MRIGIFSLILIIAMVLLLAGVAYLQIGIHEKYKIMSEENRLKVLPLMAPRGSILDRKGRVLVEDILAFNVSVLYYRIKDANALAVELNSIFEMSKEELLSRIKESKKNPYSPVCIVEDIGMEKTVHMEELGMNHPDLVLQVSAKRKYIYEETASHVLGYVGLINRSEFKKLKHYGYRINDFVGRDGVEKYYDDYLRGKHGGKQIEVDHRGREAATLGFREPFPGRDIYLTIDLDLQKYCENLMEDRKGAIVAMDPSTGAVLAMVSAPAYDPEIFIDKEKRKRIKNVLSDHAYPLLNRAISGVYPPGSVFKTMTAVSALEESKATPKTVFNCSGSFTLGKTSFACWKEKGHGDQVLQDALKNSCNVYFFKMGLLSGADKISEYAGKFGFGSSSGIDLPGERSGTLPSTAWKSKNLNKKWYKGDTVNYSIGQGYLLTSPIQVARMMSVFANGGYLMKPYVVERVDDVRVNSGEKVFLDLSPETVSNIREGLKEVVNGYRGTGCNAKQKEFIVSGKTGTAQTSKGKNHGWFAGFAPFSSAKLTVVVFDEFGGKGGYYSAKTAGEIFKKAGDLGII
ncbi:MAG: penicillin-binding protein 2 [Candidatus Omnitrophica bacterium]|nr:penicillin-binding protein 2 [Candidatus Omnitrophota bacterium]MBU1894484.1 penicillin-binding protein 2 [Candidatus Omnitrophota bacterium]